MPTRNAWRPLLSTLPDDLGVATWFEPMDPNEPHGRVMQCMQRVVQYECKQCGARWRCWDGEPTPCAACGPEKCWVCDRPIMEGDEPGHVPMDNGAMVPVCSVACTELHFDSGTCKTDHEAEDCDECGTAAMEKR